jgi:hypothetical protein
MANDIGIPTRCRCGNLVPATNNVCKACGRQITLARRGQRPVFQGLSEEDRRNPRTGKVYVLVECGVRKHSTPYLKVFKSRAEAEAEQAKQRKRDPARAKFFTVLPKTIH